MVVACRERAAPRARGALRMTRRWTDDQSNLMPTAPKPKAQPEREQTDEGLRTERWNSDQMIAERVGASATAADAVVERARERRDDLLTEARDKADENLDVRSPTVHERDVLERTRAVEDVAVQEERAAADAAVDAERALVAPTLAALLPLEREKTDKYLLSERARSDAALASRDDFLGMVAHDLRSLLSGVVLSTAALARRASDSDEGRAAPSWREQDRALRRPHEPTDR